MKKILIAVSLFAASQGFAGPYLELGLGAMLGDSYKPSSIDVGEQSYVGERAPIARIRIGYETPPAPLPWDISVTGHGYLEHTSSMGTALDTGMELLMFGVRIEK